MQIVWSAENKFNFQEILVLRKQNPAQKRSFGKFG